MERFTDSVGQRMWMHGKADCAGPCPVHAPTEHHMREWPMVWRSDRRIFERTCPHGIGHPDPDSLYFVAEFDHGGDDGTHGCCGCCVAPLPGLA